MRSRKRLCLREMGSTPGSNDLKYVLLFTTDNFIIQVYLVALISYYFKLMLTFRNSVIVFC